MKKLVLTIAIVLGMTFGASAQFFGDNGQPQGGGLFGRAASPADPASTQGGSSTPLLPMHNQEGNQNAPLGGGTLLLIGMGAAYAMAKKNRK